MRKNSVAWPTATRGHAMLGVLAVVGVRWVQYPDKELALRW
jgi:hypothetical protein